MSENKQQKFQRLAMNRVNKAIKSIELIGNLGNKSLYESTQDERKKIIKAINDSVAQMKIDLDGNSKKREGFKFD
ncbi:hypothetical protein EB151_12885 [archaeon]|jgi:hypothetical protein|nr:hypothetical protein [archaeon]